MRAKKKKIQIKDGGREEHQSQQLISQQATITVFWALFNALMLLQIHSRECGQKHLQAQYDAMGSNTVLVCGIA